MYTQCPECLTVFSLDVDALIGNRGHVSCGHCDADFDSITTLTKQLPPTPFTQLAANKPARLPPRLDLAVYRPIPPPPAVAHTDATPEPPSDIFAELVFSPRFSRQTDRRPRTSRQREPRAPGSVRWPWVAVCALLLGVLLAQLVWAQRHALVADPAVGGWLRSTCAAFSCHLPLVGDVHQLRLVARGVQAHPDVSGALMVSATVRNEAAFTQPYPVVTLTLLDAQGKRIAMRRLRAAEYLADANMQRAGLAPGASVALLFELRDPGPGAVAFDFSFE